jgi:uncharacterized DUF497 family protein
MHVDFDPAKSARNERERGFGFLFAARIFLGPTIERPDSRRDYGEARIIAIGGIDEATLVVVFTWRTDDQGEPFRWIISARPASRAERKKYAAFFT